MDSGKTIGETGSEQGVIVKDEEHGDGARITLERDCPIGPYGITCGIYGWTFHTCWFRDYSGAAGAYEQMKIEIVHILSLIPYKTDPELDRKVGLVSKAIEEFVNRH